MANNREKALIRIDRLGNDKVSRLILSFFATTFVSLILNSVYNLTDTLFISWGVGDYAMSGVAVIAPFVLLQGAISTMIGGGAATLVSIKLGDGKADEAGKITVNAMVIFYVIAIVMTAVGLIFINPLLKIMGANEAIFPYAKEYFIIILIGNIFSTGFSSIMRAEGKNLYSMFTWMTTIIVNIILDAVFILVLKWGVKGAAAATIIGQMVGVAMSIFFYAKVSAQRFKGAKIEWKTIVEIVKIGLPSLIQLGSISVVIGIINYLISVFSDPIGLVTFGYISKLIIYAIAPIMAITQAMSPVVGFNYGSGKASRVRESVRFSMLIAMSCGMVMFIIFMAIPQYLMMIFTRNSDVISQGVVGLRVIAVSLLAMPIPMLIGAKLQAVESRLWAMLIYGANVILIILPAILLGKNFGLIGLIWSYVIANLGSVSLVCIKLIIDKCKGNHKVVNDSDSSKL